MTHEDEIKSSCKVTKGEDEDSCIGKLYKDGYVFYIDIKYYYSYYHRTASYYEPEEENCTLKGIKKWKISDVERDSDDYELSNEEEVIKEYESKITEDELIELILKETCLEY